MPSECHEEKWSKECDICAIGISALLHLKKQSHPVYARQGELIEKKANKKIEEKKKADDYFIIFKS